MWESHGRIVTESRQVYQIVARNKTVKIECGLKDCSQLSIKISNYKQIEFDCVDNNIQAK